MKKLLLSLLVAMTAITSQAAITVYVQAEQAPHIWAWGGSGNIFQEAWPGPQLTDKKTVKNTTTGEDTEFWYYTFDESITTVNILFNNGGEGDNHVDVKQTGDINAITTDRYFTYDGAYTYTDITEEYGGEIPDAEVTELILVGNHNEWSGDDPYTFTVTESGKTFKGSLTVDLTGIEFDEGFWQFKIRPNRQGWVGITQVNITAPEWCQESMSQGNFQIDLEADEVVANGPKFKIDAEWVGGKDYEWGWNVTVALATGGDTPGVKGDVNGDGTVDVADISAIISVMAGTAQYGASDVNGDNTTDVADISNVISIMAGAQ